MKLSEFVDAVLFGALMSPILVIWRTAKVLFSRPITGLGPSSSRRRERRRLEGGNKLLVVASSQPKKIPCIRLVVIFSRRQRHLSQLSCFPCCIMSIDFRVTHRNVECN